MRASRRYCDAGKEAFTIEHSQTDTKLYQCLLCDNLTHFKIIYASVNR